MLTVSCGAEGLPELKKIFQPEEIGQYSRSRSIWILGQWRRDRGNPRNGQGRREVVNASPYPACCFKEVTT